MPLNNINASPYAFNFSLYVYLIEHEGILFIAFFLLLNKELKMLGVILMIAVKMFIDYISV